MIGIVLLMGLVTKNSILLVDYTNQLRACGLGIREALLEAGPVRLRPILMTSAAMVLGMLPTAIGRGEGSELRAHVHCRHRWSGHVHVPYVGGSSGRVRVGRPAPVAQQTANTGANAGRDTGIGLPERLARMIHEQKS
jgi:hypothetical protein